jgi:hypothetical protein
VLLLITVVGFILTQHQDLDVLGRIAAHPQQHRTSALRLRPYSVGLASGRVSCSKISSARR